LRNIDFHYALTRLESAILNRVPQSTIDVLAAGAVPGRLLRMALTPR
jgi:hypothetical protein